MKKKLKCPECGKPMILFENWDSINGIATWYKYGCENCAGTFEVKRGKFKIKGRKVIIDQ